jgi:hypothetical protein
MTTLEDALAQALDIVLDWDLPDELHADAVLAQAAMLAGVEPDDDPGSLLH